MKHLRSVKTIEVAGSLPVDLDTAGVALSQARAILEVLIVACDGVVLPDTPTGTLEQCLYAAQSEIERADKAIFGKG